MDTGLRHEGENSSQSRLFVVAGRVRRSRWVLLSSQGMHWSAWILIPFVGALIGYVTNTIAVMMLFRPHAPRRQAGEHQAGQHHHQQVTQGKVERHGPLACKRTESKRTESKCTGTRFHQGGAGRQLDRRQALGSTAGIVTSNGRGDRRQALRPVATTGTGCLGSRVLVLGSRRSKRPGDRVASYSASCELSLSHYCRLEPAGQLVKSRAHEPVRRTSAYET